MICETMPRNTTENKLRDIVNTNKQVCITFLSTWVQLGATWATAKHLKIVLKKLTPYVVCNSSVGEYLELRMCLRHHRCSTELHANIIYVTLTCYGHHHRDFLLYIMK